MPTQEIPVTSPEMAAIAEDMGLLYEASAPLSALLPEAQAISFWTSVGMLPSSESIYHHVHGMREGVPVNLFDLVALDAVSPDFPMQRVLTKRRTVVVLPALEELPDISLKPTTLKSRFLRSWIGSEGVSFDAGAVPEADLAEAITQFSQKYMLTSERIANAIENSDSFPKAVSDEEAIRKVFTPHAMQGLLGFSPFSLVVVCGVIVVWHGEKFKKPTERAALVEKALAIREILINAVTNENPATLVPGRPGSEIEEQAWRVAGARQYALTGSGLGFLTGLLTGGYYYALFCAAIGSLVGMRLGRFKGPKPAPPAKKVSLESALFTARQMRNAAIAGFIGFWIGLALGIVPIFMIVGWFRAARVQPPLGLLSAVLVIPVVSGFAGLLYGFKLGKRLKLNKADDQSLYASQEESG